jgi:hypothetical protein
VRLQRNVGVEAADKPGNEDVFVDPIPQIDPEANITLQELRATLGPAKRTRIWPHAKRGLFNQIKIAGKIIAVLVKKWNLSVRTNGLNSKAYCWTRPHWGCDLYGRSLILHENWAKRN